MEQSPCVAAFATDCDAEEPSAWIEARDRISFDRFMVYPQSRTICHDGTPISIGGRTFDLLLILLRSRGEVISKSDLVRRVWPRAVVEDNNVRVQMALLRKSLGAAGKLIKTVSGRGYIFVEEFGHHVM